MGFITSIPIIIWNGAVTCLMFFIFGIPIGWITANNTTFLDFIAQFGNFFAVFSALLALALTIMHKEYSRFKRIKALENICQLELEGYSDQIQDFFLYFEYSDGIFINNPNEWRSLKNKFPQSPEVFKNYGLLIELEADFISNISKLINNRTRIKKLIRKIDDIFSIRGTLSEDELSQIIRDLKILKEQFCSYYNSVSRTNKFILPENSIYHFLNR